MRYQKARIVKSVEDFPTCFVGTFLWVRAERPRPVLSNNIFTDEMCQAIAYISDVPMKAADGTRGFMLVNAEIVELEPEFKEVPDELQP